MKITHIPEKEMQPIVKFPFISVENNVFFMQINPKECVNLQDGNLFRAIHPVNYAWKNRIKYCTIEQE